MEKSLGAAGSILQPGQSKFLSHVCHCSSIMILKTGNETRKLTGNAAVNYSSMDL